MKQSGIKILPCDCPLVHVLPKGTFTEWLRSKGKLGGQHKVPRLSNERTILEEILAIKSYFINIKADSFACKLSFTKSQ